MEFERYDVTKDLVIIGAGMPGICAAIQAARLGLTVALINNRGYVGGNASAEIDVSVDGADGAQEFNLYAREGGILEEIRLENLHRNPQRNRYIWDAVLMDFLLKEKT
ncbi:FAD-dependent oxidoreductase [Mahella australiensis]|uniref:Fumarate reductase/succinate dehydrogenase flavoprotein domain protein n=1 Tax=Mahella australiensis (strain DSM 15567 / CIP 107919 / 50-1 BON) TaxID=697281 RepID=F4A123_MAHA5|nr:FAD-dependent oxidoreductase [Mahella australiensis]AEE95926.1 fumarate reductase/succinate dehydrogenase flavoprotein domain protein [Mahella australiensis 50-1 BON]